MKYQAIIFDLDGVICSTDQYHFKAWKTIADQLSIHFDEEINNRLRGVSRMESLSIILENYNGQLTDLQKNQYAHEKNLIYRRLLNNLSETDASIEVRETLHALRSKGLKLSIGSSSKNAKFILDKLGLGDFFDAIADGNDIKESKPNPEVFLKASELLSVDPRVCLVIEDSVAGIEAASAGKMDSVAIGDAVKSNLATYNINQFSQIIELI